MTASTRASTPERVLAIVAGAASAIGAAALAGIFLLVLAAVVMRYGWSRPFPFTEELAGLLMTVAVFTLLPVTVLREQHIRVTVLSERLGRTAGHAVFLLGQGVFLVFCAIFVWEAWAISAFTHKLNLMSEQSRLPLAPFLFVSTAGLAVAGLVGAWRTWQRTAPTDSEKVHA